MLCCIRFLPIKRFKRYRMQKGHKLQFHCQSCKNLIHFSVFEIERDPLISCSSCNKPYSFSEETLSRQLKKFEALCRQLVESEEILSHTSVGINVGDRHVKVPYKLLLTRLNSSLELKINGKPLTIDFRIEPLTDFPINLFSHKPKDI